MKFSLFLMYFSTLGATDNFYTVPDNKTLMYFDGSEWRTVKPKRNSTVKSAPQQHVTVNFRIFETIPTNNYNASVFNRISFKDYGIQRRAQDSDEFKTRAETFSVPEVGETNIIINRLFDLIENRYKDTKEKSRSASLLTNPKAWIKLISEISNALKDIADKANASYYKLTQESTPKYVIEPWRKVPRSRRDNAGIHGLIALFSDGADTGNETSDAEFLEDLDQKNKIYMDKIFPLKMDPTKILEKDQNGYIDTESADIISDGFEEIKLTRRKK